MAKILVIDGEGIIRKKLKHLLELEGYEVCVAGDGKEGLEILQKEKPDIALVDIRMPGMDGIEVLKRIKERSKRTEVVIITGQCEVATILQAMRAGAFGYVQKTINYDQIEIEITRALKKQEMEKKVDEYMHNLEEALEGKEHELKQRKQTEKELHKQTHDLGERVKELNCLYSISTLVEKHGISLKEILQGAVELIPPSWQYPEVTCARIVLEDRIYKTTNFKESIWKQASDIFVKGNRIGNLEVYYLEEKPEEDEGVFLKEERNLINDITERVGKAIERVRAEKKVSEAKEKFSGLVTNMPGVVYRCACDQDWTMEFISDEIEELTGYPASDFLQNRVRSYASIMHPDDRQKSEDTALNAINHNLPYILEYRVIHRDGSARWAYERGKAIKDNGGGVTYLDGAIFDITERKEAEESLRESEMINRSLLEGSPVCNKIITTDFKLQYMSSAGVETLKISDINTCYGKEYPPKFFCEESRIAIIKKLKVALTGEISEVECITHTTEGDELWYLHTFVPVIGVDGQVKYIIGSSVNVTDRKRSEEKVKLAAEEWSTTFNSMMSLVSIQDKDCKIVRVNKAYADTLKLKPEELIGKPCYEVIHGTKEPWPDCPHKKTLDNKKTFTEDFIEPRLGIHIEVSTSPIFNDKDEIVGTVHIATDITKRKEMEKNSFNQRNLNLLVN